MDTAGSCINLSIARFERRNAPCSHHRPGIVYWCMVVFGVLGVRVNSRRQPPHQISPLAQVFKYILQVAPKTEKLCTNKG